MSGTALLDVLTRKQVAITVFDDRLLPLVGTLHLIAANPRSGLLCGKNPAPVDGSTGYQISFDDG
jgi:hypothetical protein